MERRSGASWSWLVLEKGRVEGIITTVVMLVAGSLLCQCGRRTSQWLEQEPRPAATRHSEQLIKAGLCRQVEKQAATQLSTEH